MDPISTCKDLLVGRLAKLLGGRSFGAHQESDAGKHHLYRWERDGRRKVDVVQLSFSRNLPRCFDVGLFVELPCGEERHFLDTRGLQAILGKARDYCMPALALEPRCGRFAAEVCDDLDKALPWLDGYSSAASALEMLRGGRIENAPRGGPVRALFEDYLRSVAASE